MDCFYTAGFSILQRHNNVHGMLVSDCAVLFAVGNHLPIIKLRNILSVTEQLNRELIRNEIMLTTSIAYGQFKYHQRLEFPGIEKNPIYGHAYIAAFLDNESGHPRIQPGQCRIVKKNLPPIDFSDLERTRETKNHYYYYWMLSNSAQIQNFNNLYNDAYQLKYRGMLDAINKAVSGTLPAEPNF